MDVDEALNKLGRFGKWQIMHFVMLGLAVMVPSAFHTLAIVYIGYKPPHRCKIPENSTLNEWIPYEGDDLSSCKMFANYTLGNETTDCLHGWEYLGDDGPTIVTKVFKGLLREVSMRWKSTVLKSVISFIGQNKFRNFGNIYAPLIADIFKIRGQLEWNLVCSREVLAQTSQTVLSFGIMVGAIFTTLSDRYGRKPVFLFSQVMLASVGIITAFVENIYLFFFLRFLAGALQQGVILPGFILMLELFSTKYRTFVGIIIEIFWSLAICIFPLLAYLIRNWKYLQICISLIGLLLTIPLFKYLPESVTWLFANGKVDKAEEILRRALKFNNIHESEAKIVSVNEADKLFLEKDSRQSTNYSCFDFFKHKRLLLHLVVCSVSWIVVTMAYYGLTLSTAQLAGDRYWNGFFNGLVEFPANLLLYFVVIRYGRKWPLIGWWLVSGIALFITPFLPMRTESGVDLSALNVSLTMVGKFGITCVFSILVMYAPELFPTNLRVQAAGLCSFVGRVGNFVASYASYIMEKHPLMLLTAFGTLSFISAILVLFLPETQNRPLPETIEDIEVLNQNSSKTRNDSNESTLMKCCC